MTRHETAIKLLCSELKKISIRPEQSVYDSFAVYMDEMINWNSRMNLTSIVDPVDVVIKHFYDSVLYMAGAACMENGRIGEVVADVGSGAGFPGIPILLLDGMSKLVIIEKSRKKCTFLLHMVSRLDIADRVEIRCSRVEHISREQPSSGEAGTMFDAILLRAVRLDDALVKELRLLLTMGGSIVYGLGKKELDITLDGFKRFDKRFTLPVSKHVRQIITLVKT